MYALYFNREEGVLKIKKNPKAFVEYKDKVIKEPYKYNNNYYFCSTRKPLKELAEAMKLSWIGDAYAEVHRLEKIEIS